jgi:HNH endonuclease
MRRSVIGERMEIYAYYGQMVAISKLLPPEEQADLERWDKAMITGDGRYGTSDWPGWAKYIGRRPEFPPVPEHKEPIPAERRWQVWERDDFTCRHCGARRHLSVDHIIPESKGGTLSLDNLQTLCRSCNSRKGTKMPEESESKDGSSPVVALNQAIPSGGDQR